VTAAPSDAELLDGLRARGVDAVGISRRPYSYATSAPLEEVSVRAADGGELTMILKDLTRERLLPEARTSKPEFVYEPRRELETYRAILTPVGIGPRCYATAADGDAPRYWLLLDKVPGVELWQVGELEVWEEIAAWIGAMHARFEGRGAELRRANPYLLQYSVEWLCEWRDRACAALAASADPRAAQLAATLAFYEPQAEMLAALPRTFVHGELYPSNVLVVRGERPVGVFPVDWEMAAIAPGVVDLAALVGGWADDERRRLIDAYDGAVAAVGGAARSAESQAQDLARCRLHLALQWLGWARGWVPPREHAHDWLGEALTLASQLGLREAARGG
jgi:aminoglycoside phosphotransferase (APT) family kinase protein